jgi:hypothetical protein
VGCGGHGAEEGTETEVGWGSYGGWKGWVVFRMRQVSRGA